MWWTQYGVCTIILSDILFSKNLAMSILSLPALVKKGVKSLFLPRKALFIDLEDKMKILGTVTQAEYGLFYISDQK